jgi:Monogalactosyldiacylglycerol (MGDG) synthase
MTMTMFAGLVLSILQIFITASSSVVVVVVAFSPAINQAGRRSIHVENHLRQQQHSYRLSAVAVLDDETTTRTATTTTTTVETNKNTIDDAGDKDRVYTVQILMSDTGGGHRASANAIRDALDVLHPGRFVCDIVDLYTEYGPFFPYNDYPRMYKIMAKYSWMWDLFYKFGETEFGLALNEFLLTTFCARPFRECLERKVDPATMVSPKQRADMVVSVHPLCQDVPLKVLEELDGGKRTTPFVTVVTDLGGAHKTWFNPRYVGLGGLIRIYITSSRTCDFGQIFFSFLLYFVSLYFQNSQC